MSTVEFVSKLQSLGVRLYLEEGRFRCSAPPGVLTPELRTSIQERNAELTRLLAETSATPTATSGPTRTASSGPVVLSLAQRRQWFLEQLHGHSPTYNVTVAIRLMGRLDPESLVRALREIVRRHEALRTTFTDVEGEPVQVVNEHLVLEVPLSGCDEASVAARFDGFARQAFDLASGPLIRAALLRLAAEDWVLMINMHHIVCDGWSIGVLIREWVARYSAFAAGQPPPLPELTLQ